MLKKFSWKKILLLVIGLFALYIIGSRLNSKYNLGPTGEETTLGEPLRIGHGTYTINELEVLESLTLDDEEMTVEDGDGVFVIADLTIENHFFNRSMLFSAQNIYLQADGEFYPSYQELTYFSALGTPKLLERLAEEWDVQVFEPPVPVVKRDSTSGTVVFVASKEWLEAEDAAIYIMALARDGSEQDGYMYLNREVD